MDLRARNDLKTRIAYLNTRSAVRENPNVRDGPNLKTRVQYLKT